MNVTLPEKEKVNKKILITYLIIIIICILAIIVIAGVQILGDEVIDSIFGINKIVAKSEEEEAELKANFENLFNNQLENKNNNFVTKIDEEKDVVYTQYEKIEISKDNYELNVNIPYINIKNKTVQNYNQKIIDEYQIKVNDILNTTDKNIVYSVKYVAHIKNNILSLIIYSDLKQDKASQRSIIETFNFNLENNKELSFEDILNIYNLDKKKVQDKINKDIQEEQDKSNKLKDLGYNVFSRDLYSEIYKVENINNFFVHDNNIYIIFSYGIDEVTSEKDIIII